MKSVGTTGTLIRGDSAHAPRLVIWAFVISLLVLFLVYLTYQRPPFVVINANTEILTYQVAREGLAAFSVESANAKNHPANCGPLISNDGIFTGLVSPTDQTMVTYRQAQDNIVVQFKADDSAGVLTTPSQTNCTLGPEFQVTFKRGSGADINAADLPIAGPAQMGAEVGDRVVKREGGKRDINRLREGELQVLGRSSLIGEDGSLYPAGPGKLPIPAGSRLTTLETKNEEDAWYGVALPGEKMLEVSATTESRQLRLYRPGSSQDFETFRPTLFATLFNDPKIAFISFFFITFTIVVQVLTVWFTIREYPSTSGELSE